MTARHAAPDRDRLGTVLTTGWAALNLAGPAVLGVAVHQSQAADADHLGYAATVPDGEPAAA
ncbi:hypothetical protein OG455_31610 [Kitasatospora sp. NBC_01287]|uniref:hypothetical protein n=1 Tax=Kitasatospora sp. NBC_01287 TaxID=2903573 RepID=UPI0022547709|nr:hypothetical protein [Kitasatospora sp. NBC_01287]MCX4750013.1 hypothetical protein [Kitasatospora sp. NBC_01287]